MGEALSFGKLILPGDRVGIVGECDTNGKFIFSTDCIVNRRNDGLFGVVGSSRRLPDLPLRRDF